MVNVMPKQNHRVIADGLGTRNQGLAEYWQRFEDAFATEANEFTKAVLEDTPVPLHLQTGITVMKIGRGLRDALLTGELVRFSADGNRLN